ncbi:MAG TPA: hypothetical protein VGJ64_06800, partial [Gemmatimonadaceae bacterium]
HLLIRLEIIALTGKETRDRDLVVLVRLYPQLTSMVTVWNESLVELLNRERKCEILRVTVPDVAHEPVKYAI